MNFKKTTHGDYVNLDLVDLVSADGMVELRNGKISRQIDGPLPWQVDDATLALLKNLPQGPLETPKPATKKKTTKKTAKKTAAKK